MNECVDTIILGIVEGITEFLPISSTGHLLIAENFLSSQRTEFFNVGIQAGAILAVVFVYWKKLLNLAWHWKEKENKDFILKCGAAFGVTAVLGLIAKKMGFNLEDSNILAVAWAVNIGALVIFLAEWWLKRKEAKEMISWPTAILVGVSQVVAGVFPGTSRSAATIVAAMFMGSSRAAATEFSFLLSIPTMFAASGYVLLKDLKEKGIPPTSEIQQFILGFAVSMIVAFVAVKWLLKFLQSHTFTPFAWYRLGLGVALMAWLMTS